MRERLPASGFIWLIPSICGDQNIAKGSINQLNVAMEKSTIAKLVKYVLIYFIAATRPKIGSIKIH